MTAFGEWLRRIWYLANRRHLEAALDREMDAHREMMGHAGRTRFGNTLRLRESARDVWGWDWLDSFVRDLRFATRSLSASPAFTVVAISSLALGLTLAASTIAVLNAYLIRSLPYPAANRLYHVMYAPAGPYEPGGMSGLDWASVSDVVEFPVTASGGTFYLAGNGYAQPARGLRVGTGFLTALGVRAVLGRTLTAEDFTASQQAVMIGHALWRDRFGGDSAVIGRTFTAEIEQGGANETFRIVGVLPPGFWFGRESSAIVDVLVPLTARARTYMVRLRDGVPVGLAEQRITVAARAVASSLLPNWTGVHLESARERYVSEVRPVLFGITAAAGIVLAIACTNVAVLVLLRAMRRQKEMSVRMALGAGRRHIVRLLVTESALLCGAALIAVVVLTSIILRVLTPLIEAQLGRPAPAGVAAITIDPTVLFVIAAAAVVIALSLSLAPLATPWQRLLAATLGQSGRHGTDGTAMRRLRTLLIGVELAGSVVLLVGCGMMIRSVLNMVNADLGFRTDHIVSVRVVVPSRVYSDASSMQAFYRRLIGHAAAFPGSRAALATWPPFAEALGRPFVADGGDGGQRLAGVNVVSTDYFDVLRIGIREGRAFTAEDRDGTEPVVVISERLAKQLWPTGSAIGRRLRTVDRPAAGTLGDIWRTVVGVVANVRQSYTDADIEDAYLPFAQVPPDRYGTFYMRTAAPASVVESSIRAALARTDPAAVVRGTSALEKDNRTLAGTRFLTWMLSGFAIFSAFLAIVGMHGVIAYAVLQRRREFAIRIALGATSRAITALSMRGAVVVLASGIGCGVLTASVAGRVLQSRLYGVPPFDIGILLTASVAMALAGALAIWWPARRAAAVDPSGIGRASCRERVFRVV